MSPQLEVAAHRLSTLRWHSSSRVADAALDIIDGLWREGVIPFQIGPGRWCAGFIVGVTFSSISVTCTTVGPARPTKHRRGRSWVNVAGAWDGSG